MNSFDFNPEWIGMVAGTLTTCAFLPQVVRTVRTKSSKDLSWSWLFMFLTGVSLWLVFGLMSASLSVSVANAITLVCVLVLVATKWRYEGPPIKLIPPEERGGQHWRCFGCGQCATGCPLHYGKPRPKRDIIKNTLKTQNENKQGSDSQ